MFCRLDQILGKQGSKAKDVYESKICLASRIVKVERQVRRERRALVTLMNSDCVDLDEGARSWKFHKCVCLKMDSGPLWQFSLIRTIRCSGFPPTSTKRTARS